MGDTFNTVKEDSDKEWRFTRYSLATEYPINDLLLFLQNVISNEAEYKRRVSFDDIWPMKQI